MTEVDASRETRESIWASALSNDCEGAEKVGQHKTSMLQDIEAGKPTELEAIVGAIIELGDKLAWSYRIRNQSMPA
jgi:2-dehydropantoate 2-reductase